jgi:hypothetical protein
VRELGVCVNKLQSERHGCVRLQQSGSENRQHELVLKDAQKLLSQFLLWRQRVLVRIIHSVHLP